MNVSVFGGSSPKPGDQAYEEAILLGRLLAQKGHTVLTGGYMGTMEAVSRGASESGGHVIGVTCEEIERWRPVGRNAWVREEWRRKTLLERLKSIIEYCDAAIALPGGPGTLTEIALTWNLMTIESLSRKPLILIGEGWLKVFEKYFSTLGAYTHDGQKDLVQFASDVQSAARMLAN